MRLQSFIPLLLPLILGSVLVTSFNDAPNGDVWNLSVLDGRYGRIVGTIVEESCINGVTYKMAKVMVIQAYEIFELDINVMGEGSHVDSTPLLKVAIAYVRDGNTIAITEDNLRYSIRRKFRRQRTYCHGSQSKEAKREPNNGINLSQHTPNKRPGQTNVRQNTLDQKRRQDELERKRKLDELERKRKQEELDRKRKLDELERKRKLDELERKRKQEELDRKRKLDELDRQRKLDELDRQRKLDELDSKSENKTLDKNQDQFINFYFRKNSYSVKSRPSTLNLKPKQDSSNLKPKEIKPKRKKNASGLARQPDSLDKKRRVESQQFVLGKYSVYEVTRIPHNVERKLNTNTQYQFLVTVTNQQLRQSKLAKLFNDYVIVPRHFNQTLVTDLSRDSRLIVKPISIKSLGDQCTEKDEDLCTKENRFKDDITTQLDKFVVKENGPEWEEQFIDNHVETELRRKYKFRIHVIGGKVTPEVKQALREMMNETIESNFTKQEFTYKNLKIIIEFIYKKNVSFDSKNATKLPLKPNSKHLNTHGLFKLNRLERYELNHTLTDIKKYIILVKATVLNGYLDNLELLRSNLTSYASKAYQQVQLMGSPPVSSLSFKLNKLNVKLELINSKKEFDLIERDSDLVSTRVTNLDIKQLYA